MTRSAIQPTTPQLYPCENCGHWFTLGTLACPNCGALIYRRRLEQLSADAIAAEPVDPMRAAMIWRQCLDLLPPQSPQYQSIAQRVGALSAGLVRPQFGGGEAAQAYGGEMRPGRAVRPPDALPVAVAKTAGSMLLSILFYTLIWQGPPLQKLFFGIGFAGLILVHELGHVIAMRHYKLSASPPIFIPFLGAVINMREAPRNAWVEAVVGIGGPALGTAGALVLVGIFLGMGFEPGSDSQELVHALAYFGVFINLFNLLPFPPLDGGRISAALSPWMWLTGVVGLGVLLYYDQIPLYMAALLIFAGLPRIVNTLRARQARNNPYYQIPKVQSVTMAICYVALAALLTGLLLWLKKPMMLS
jgi:Zn-dependent protease